jgi:hypothetical protein
MGHGEIRRRLPTILPGVAGVSDLIELLLELFGFIAPEGDDPATDSRRDRRGRIIRGCGLLAFLALLMSPLWFPPLR